MATTDEAKLRQLLAEVSVDSEALAAMLAALAPAEPREGLTDPDDIPEPPDEAVTKPGDLWLLGDHRMLCGDAGSEADLDRLLDGATVDLLLTDPPYNVKVEPRSNVHGKGMPLGEATIPGCLTVGTVGEHRTGEERRDRPAYATGVCANIRAVPG